MSDTEGAKPWFFDLWSSFYDEALVQRLVYRPVHDAIVEALRQEPVQRLLDLGCGTGLLTSRLKREVRSPRVVGLDYSPGMLAQAKRNPEHIDWVQAGASALPFADASFDAITSSEAFHWFPDQALALRECHRVLRPGGRVLVAIVNPDFELVGSVAGMLSSALGQPLEWPSADGMRRLLENAGFELVAQRRVFRPVFGLLLPPVLSIARRPCAS